MDITNKTRKAMSLPLPGGKRLFLAPGKTGQVSPKALEHPLLVKLLEAGDLESAAGGRQRGEAGVSPGDASPGSRQAGSTARRPSGDR